MRTWIKVLLIISAACIGMGILCCCLTVALGGVDLTNINNVTSFSEISSTFDEISYISITDEYNDVIVTKGEGDFVKVTYTETDKSAYDIDISASGNLRITFRNNRKWHEYISFGSPKTHKLMVEIPEKEFEYFSATTLSGDIKVSDLLSEEAYLKSTSGAVMLDGNLGELTLKTTSGDISVSSKLKAAKASISSNSGEIQVSGDFSGSVYLHTTSGDIRFGHFFGGDVVAESTSGDIENDLSLSLNSLDINTTSGDVELKNSSCLETCKINTNSGDIWLERFDASDYNLRTISGEIEANILSPKLYNIHTTSGRIHAHENESVEGVSGVFDARTTSGNISVEVVEK